MKRCLSIFLLATAFLVSLTGLSFSCDFCILSQGISPLETMHGGGIRVNERYTLLDNVYKGTGKAANPGVKEEFWTTEVTGFYGVTEDFMLLGIVPYKKTKMNGELIVNDDGTLDKDPMTGSRSGLGDIALLGRYSFVKIHSLDTTTTVAGIAGVKFATGSTNGKTSDGMEYLDSHIQLGTGSTDILLGVSLNHSVRRFSISANLLDVIPGKGKFGDTSHKFGNTLNYDLTAKYRVYPDVFAPLGPQIFLALGVNGELRGKETVDGATDPNSGGNTTYLSPGVQLVFAPHWVFELSYQHAVYHNLNGTQLGEKYKTTGGVTYLF
ncbi:MAG: transporter [Deltaproteobacteria bacterium]|nr:transporter [Deltaproteobacteria bacterium]